MRDYSQYRFTQNGFTLIEIILSLSILAIIGILTINMLSSQLAIREKVTEKNSNEHVIDRAMSRIYHDIESAYISNQNNLSALNLAYRQVVPQFYYRSSNLVFSAQNFHSYLRDSTQSNLYFVRYFIRIDPENSKKNQLIRVTDNVMAQDIENPDVGISEVIIPDLKEFSILFWDGEKFRPDWNSTANDTQNKLPKLVKIHLSIFISQNSRDQQLESQNADLKERKAISLDSIVYIASTVTQAEVNPEVNEYKWE